MEADFNDMVKRLQDPMLNEKDKKELEQKAQIKRCLLYTSRCV